MKNVLITGSSGLIGSEAVTFYDERGWKVHGIDNNMRKDFFGDDGDTTWNLDRLRKATKNFEHYSEDIRDRERILDLFKTLKPDYIIHCAAQPSHDLAKDRPFDDFDINATGTLNLLEAARRHCPESPFVFMSTNKVYGDAPNEIPVKEEETRWEYANVEDYDGIDENCRIDQSMHSLFGASKVAADIMVQEYGRYFDMPTVCFRGGCLTGPQHSGAELHGFLAYLAKATFTGRTYRIFGYKGKQVRDNIHAHDVLEAFQAYYDAPRPGAVYNLGGGRSNSISLLEAKSRFETLLGKTLSTEYVDQNRMGDHICYISDLSRFKNDYPGWDITIPLDQVFEEIADTVKKQLA